VREHGDETSFASPISGVRRSRAARSRRYRGRVPIEMVGARVSADRQRALVVTLPGTASSGSGSPRRPTLPARLRLRRRSCRARAVRRLGQPVPRASRAVADGIAEKVRAQLERDVLPAFVAKRRWFAGRAIASPAWRRRSRQWPGEARDWLVRWCTSSASAASARPISCRSRCYGATPTTIHCARSPRSRSPRRASRRSSAWSPTRSATKPSAGRCSRPSRRRHAEDRVRTLRFARTDAFARLAGDAATPQAASWPDSTAALRSSGSAIAWAQVYRHLHVGVDPESKSAVPHRRAGYANALPIAGTIEYRSDEGARRPSPCCMAAREPGSAWISRSTTSTGSSRMRRRTRRAPTRTAAISRSCARSAGAPPSCTRRSPPPRDPAFDPEPCCRRPRRMDERRARRRAGSVRPTSQCRGFAAAATATGPCAARAARRSARRIDRHASDRLDAPKTRLHGDFQLDELLARNDWVIVDFGGEPSGAGERAPRLAVRECPMLRSFDYAMHSGPRAAAGGTHRRRAGGAGTRRPGGGPATPRRRIRRDATRGLHRRDETRRRSRLFLIERRSRAPHERINRPDGCTSRARAWPHPTASGWKRTARRAVGRWPPRHGQGGCYGRRKRTARARPGSPAQIGEFFRGCCRVAS